MPYNLGMTEITLALPYALPPPEMASDLLRALQMPALAALLSRNSEFHFYNTQDADRALPHETWLAHALALTPAASGAGLPLAVAVMRGLGLQAEAADGHWFMLQPTHIQLSRTHMLLADPRQLHLSDPESRTLYELARPLFESLGKPLLYGDASLWFVRADDWSGLDTASPDAAAMQSVGDFMPEGERARDYRKLQNEIQMLWHEHPVNQARQARGLAAVNSFWLWGGADATATAATVALSIGGGPAWMQALAAPELRRPSAAQLIALPGAQTAMLPELIPSAQTGDWSDWIARMRRIEDEWCAPLLAALNDGRIGRVTLMLSRRNGWMSVSGGKLAQRKFWRKPTLNYLKQA